MAPVNQPGGGASSPAQQHPVFLATDLLWITGVMETMGNPHNYLNQENLNFFRVVNPRLLPWTFTGLPATHVPELILSRERVQMVIFPGAEAAAQFRPPIRTSTLVLYYPLAVVNGNAPFLSEARLHNFMDFWKGVFFPVTDVALHFIAEGMVDLPLKADVAYFNRNFLQAYHAG